MNRNGALMWRPVLLSTEGKQLCSGKQSTLPYTIGEDSYFGFHGVLSRCIYTYLLSANSSLHLLQS
jgi:hypothetical protein